MNDILSPATWSGGLFIALLLSIEAGRRLGRQRLARYPEGATAGTGVVDGAIFGLFGLLVAFTFSGAASRFDARRAMIAQEANDIGTSYLRVDLLPAAAQPAMRGLFRDYVESRLAVYGKLPDVEAAEAELVRSARIQSEIWKIAMAAAAAKGDPATTTLITTALNAMIDITTTRTMSARMHPPLIIFLMLCGLAVACAVLVGHGMAGEKRRNWVYVIAFAGIISLTVYVILDIEFPRFGLIRENAFDQVLVDLRNSMN